MKLRTRNLLTAMLATTVLCSVAAAAHADVERSSGQTVYVPIYSRVFRGAKLNTFQLAATASVRNTDPEHPIRITVADYYDFNGKKVRGYVTSPLILPPLGSREFYVREDDTRGGSGANFIIEWTSDEPVTTPMLEGVMIGNFASQGISFTSRGQVIDEKE